MNMNRIIDVWGIIESQTGEKVDLDEVRAKVTDYLIFLERKKLVEQTKDLIEESVDLINIMDEMNDTFIKKNQEFGKLIEELKRHIQ